MNRFRTGIVTLAVMCVPGATDAHDHIDLTGVWAQRLVTTSVSKLPVIGKVENESRFYGLVGVQQDGKKIAMTVEPCWVRMIGEVKRVKTIVPDEAVAVMGPKRRTGSYDGNRVTIRRAVDVLGARLGNEWRDPLPNGPDDPTAWDEDGDGKPGVTIRIIGPVDGDVYVAQRSWNDLSGTVTADGARVLGLVNWGTEQEVLDGTSMFLKANPVSRPHPDRTKSYFEMVRMPSITTCSDIKTRNDRLFEETP